MTKYLDPTDAGMRMNVIEQLQGIQFISDLYLCYSVPDVPILYTSV